LWHAPVIPSYSGKHKIEELRSRSVLVKRETPPPKVTRAKRAGCMAQAVEHLPHKHNVLNLNPSTAKKWLVMSWMYRDVRGRAKTTTKVYFVYQYRVAVLIQQVITDHHLPPSTFQMLWISVNRRNKTPCILFIFKKHNK
jgi:hypothetical protein